jgi:hypothetical protein
MSMTDQGKAVTVYAYLSATQSPTDAPPYGVFRMDYIGKTNGQTGFNGYVNSQPGTISFLETGANSANTALAMSASSTTSGSGTMSIAGGGGGGSGSATFNFAYSSSYFRRSDGTHDECFDRTKANAAISVWRYGTYNANDGSRVDQAHPGFPIVAAYNGVSYYGYANYWGINFQGLDLNSVADASPIPNLSVTDQRSGNTTAYNLSKVGGKLTKWTQTATTLGALDGIPFTFGADLTNQTNNTTAVSGWNNWIVQWSTATLSFTVTGIQTCGSNGCVPSALAGNATATINSSFLATNPIMGWSDSFGGSLNIPSTGGAHAANDSVYYYTQSTVVPGSSGEPTALYCLSQCPTATALSAFSAGSSTSPYGAGTAMQWFSAPSANTVAYAFGATGLVESSTAMVLEQASQYPSGSMYAQSGIMTGRLFDTALSASNCPSGMPSGTVCEPANPAAYYTWQTGTNQWSQSLWLTKASDNSVVPLDAPQNVPYTVPTGAAYGTFAGKSILLQFNGFGNLFGVPGYCVDPVTNAMADCSVNGARYVPMFSIADGATMTLPATSSTAAVPLIVKALDAEVRLKDLGASASTPCASMTLSTMTLPSVGTHDPSSSTDSEYLGTMPTVTSAPKVIDGVVQ